MAEGPEVALAIMDGLMREPALKGYHLLPSVRGDLLHKLGRYEEARAAFEEAAALAGNRREHDLLRRRATEGPTQRCHDNPVHAHTRTRVDRAWIDRFRGFCHRLWKAWPSIAGECPRLAQSRNSNCDTT